MPQILDVLAPNMSARVHGMMSGLMPRADMDALIDSGSLEAMTNALLSSAYEVEMAEAMSRYAGSAAIEDAIARNLVNTFSKLRRLCRGRYAELAAIFVARWDLAAIKALLRNRHHEIDAEQGADALLQGPSIPVAVLRELSAQETMDALVRGLAGWNPGLCGALAEALGEYQESHNIAVLEQALDRRYFVGSVRKLGSRRDVDSRFLMDLLRMEIDRINLRMLFGPRSPGTVPEDLIRDLLPRGVLPEATLRNIAATPTPDRAVAYLDNTAYAGLTDGIAYYAETGRFSLLERQCELAFLKRLEHASHQRPLGIPILMRYAWLKFNEAVNLRMIAQALLVHLPRERVMQEVLYV